MRMKHTSLVVVVGVAAADDYKKRNEREHPKESEHPKEREHSKEREHPNKTSN